jgi:twinkle protein
MTVVDLRRPFRRRYCSVAQLPKAPSIIDLRISAGWPELDAILWLYPGQFVVTTGEPESGKSIFWFNIICNLAHQRGVRTWMHVPENRSQLATQLRRIWGVRGDQAFQYFIEEQCLSSEGEEFDLADDPAWTLREVLRQAQHALDDDPALGLVYLDPWNEIEWAKQRDMSSTDYISDCLRQIKMFSRRNSVVVVMVAHPTKEAMKERQLTLNDIGGSAAWWAKCDNGLIINRDKEGRPTCEVRSEKCRFTPDAGKRGFCFFHVNEMTGEFAPYRGMSSPP